MFQRVLFITAICLGVTGLPTSSAATGIYKWTDDSGKIHYSDKPPVNQKSTTMNPHTAVPQGSHETGKVINKQAIEFNKRRDKRLKQEAEKKKKLAEQEKREQQCATLRKNLQIMLTRNRVTKMVDGKQVVIPYEERLKKMEQIQKNMEKVCK